jgi:DNA invertase Pin-like site-specific DNA recombinase
MPFSLKEDRITLAIQANRKSKKNNKKPLSTCQAARIFNIPKTTLRRRINNQRNHDKSRMNNHKLDKIKEETLIRHIIEQDAQGFPMQPSGVEDMANLLLASRNGKPIGTK